MKKVQGLLISFMTCFAVAGISADVKVDNFANISLAQEALEFLSRDESAILISIRSGDIEIRKGAKQYFFPSKQRCALAWKRYEWIPYGMCNVDFTIIPDDMSSKDYRKECLNTQALKWWTKKGSAYELRVNTETKIVKFSSSESFLRRDLKDGSILLLLGQITDIKKTTIWLQPAALVIPHLEQHAAFANVQPGHFHQP